MSRGYSAKKRKNKIQLTQEENAGDKIIARRLAAADLQCQERGARSVRATRAFLFSSPIAF